MDRKSRSTLGASAVLLVFVAFALAGGQAAALAGPPEDPVLDWNLNALDALFNAPTATPPTRPGAGQTPGVAQLHMAMVQGAVHDVVNMIEGGHEPYLDGLPSASAAASTPAAVATAAHHVLVGLGIAPVPALPTATRAWLDDAYAASLAGIPDGQAKTDGVAAGAAAASAMLTERTGDGRYVPFSFTCSEAVGAWRPATATTCTTPSGPSDPFAWVAKMKPFTLESTSQFRSKGPAAIESRRYAEEYDEVKRLGGNGTTTPTERTAEQNEVVRFFSVIPARMYSSMLRGLAQEKGLTVAEQARLFGLVNLSAADAVINCWDDKLHWSNWRPITAIRLGDSDGNPMTVGDDAWTPIFPTPPYPDQSSGYNCITAGYMNAARAFFGRDKVPFELRADVSFGVPQPVTMTRSYERFTDVVEDTIDARVWQGIHLRTADEAGAEIGKNVARWVEKHYLEPVCNKHGRCRGDTE